MKKTRKPLAIVIASALVAVLGIGSTVAWLTDQSDKVENTFTVGNINIELVETGAEDGDEDGLFEKSYKMVPGDTLAKDPTVTVKANSEKCYLFVEVEKSENFDTYLTYAIDGGWSNLEGNVYYQVVDAKTANQTFAILKDNRVTVRSDVTKAMMDSFDVNKDGSLSDEESRVLPNISFKAYAVQFANIADANENDTAVDEAWANAKANPNA